jgi:tRNA (guanine-N7-)-methyltransferase
MEALLVPWRALDWPVDWASVFGRTAPLTLEIGFGNGAFLLDQAQRRPGTDHIGIEVSLASIRRLCDRVRGAGLTNVRVLHGDAAIAARYLLPPHALDEVFINHPDPWPKKRHHDRRLVRADFLDLLVTRMRPGARLTVVTDHDDYAHWMRAVLLGRADLEPEWVDTTAAPPAGRTETRYERKARAAGLPIHYFVLRARPGPVPDEPPLKVGEMQIVILEGLDDATDLVAPVLPRTWQETWRGLPVVIHLDRTWRQIGGDDGLVELVVQEGELRQHFAFALQRRAGGRVTIKAASMGAPRPTWGVRRALWHLSRYLVHLHPSLRIVTSDVERVGRDSA